MTGYIVYCSNKNGFLMVAEVLQKENIAKNVLNFLIEECGLQDEFATTDAQLFTTNALSSLDMIDLSMFIEAEYGVVVMGSDATLEALDSPELMADYILEKRSATI
jgi:acyl carrier protein